STPPSRTAEGSQGCSCHMVVARCQASRSSSTCSTDVCIRRTPDAPISARRSALAGRLLPKQWPATDARSKSNPVGYQPEEAAKLSQSPLLRRISIHICRIRNRAYVPQTSSWHMREAPLREGYVDGTG